MHSPRFHLQSLLLIALGCAICTGVHAAVFPGKTWDVAERPEDHGFTAPKLALAREYAATIKTSAVMLVHDGVVVTQWGDVDQKLNTHSIRKSFLSALYGRPVREGQIKLDATLAELGLDDTPPLTITSIRTSPTRACPKAALPRAAPVVITCSSFPPITS